jgi:hypothetical protein
MRQDIRATETVHPWHALYLENEYLKCTIRRSDAVLAHRFLPRKEGEAPLQPQK